LILKITTEEENCIILIHVLWHARSYHAM
jgi:hypothetical protein